MRNRDRTENGAFDEAFDGNEEFLARGLVGHVGSLCKREFLHRMWTRWFGIHRIS